MFPDFGADRSSRPSCGSRAGIRPMPACESWRPDSAAMMPSRERVDAGRTQAPTSEPLDGGPSVDGDAREAAAQRLELHRFEQAAIEAGALDARLGRGIAKPRQGDQLEP